MQTRIKDEVDFSQEILVGRSQTDFSGDKNKISRFLKKRERKGSLICEMGSSIEFDADRNTITYTGHALLNQDVEDRYYAVSLLGIELDELAEFIASFLKIKDNSFTHINILACYSALAPRDNNQFFYNGEEDLSFCEKLILKMASILGKNYFLKNNMVITGNLGEVIFGNNGRVTVKGERHNIVRGKNSGEDNSIYEIDYASGFVSIHSREFINFCEIKEIAVFDKMNTGNFSLSRGLLFSNEDEDPDYKSDNSDDDSDNIIYNPYSLLRNS